MRCPSTTRLVDTFKIDRKTANLVRRIAHATDKPNVLAFDPLAGLIEARCPATHAYARSCYSDPYSSHMWRVTMALHAINGLLEMHGVESLRRRDDGCTGAPSHEYLNAGDTYATTLIYTRATDALTIGCWGDIVERDGEAYE